MKRIEMLAGETIIMASKKAIDHAYIWGCEIVFNFNGHDIVARHNSSWEDLCTIYDLKCLIARMKAGYV